MGNTLVKMDNTLGNLMIVVVFFMYLCWSTGTCVLFHADRALESELKQAFVSDRERFFLQGITWSPASARTMCGWGESIAVLHSSLLCTGVKKSWGRGSSLQAAGERFSAVFGFMLV